MEVLEISQLDVAVFRKKFIEANKPALIRGIFLADPVFNVSPKCLTSSLLERFGSHIVPLKQNEDCIEKYTLSDWFYDVDRIRSAKWYVKDFHPFLGCAFEATCPEVFRDDWLNQYLLARQTNKDYRFLYWGDKGTGTTLHEDVMKSFSWSLNLQGSKKWTFFPVNENVYTVIQYPRDCIFVPAGLPHTVENLEDDTISVNHNWFNLSNLDMVLDDLLSGKN